MGNDLDIVQQLWSLCNVLRDDGITYHQYVNELTYLLFLKMAEETGAEIDLPQGYRWRDLTKLSGEDQFDFYRNQLAILGTRGSPRVRAIFANPTSLLRHPHNLNTLVRRIDELDWYQAREEGLGDVYEGLLQKNANEKKSGAGQYFTARPLIDSMVSVMKPTVDDTIQDPAAGTGGFLVAADRYIRQHSDSAAWSGKQRRKYGSGTFVGMEHVQDTYRLALMNLMLHGIESESPTGGVHFGDTLGPQGQALPKVTLMLTNPPFGNKSGGGLPSRTDLPFPTSNKQLSFLQHIYLKLVPGGRAAVVLPDNVLFEGTIGRQVREDLMEKCNLHTILRLPSGIFYAHGVKTNVLFFTRGEQDRANTREVWIYDLRTNMPQFGRRTPLDRQHFTEFESAFGADPCGGCASLAARVGVEENVRFRRFSRDWIANHGNNLDITWLHQRHDSPEAVLDPAVLAQEAADELDGALEELRSIIFDLGEDCE
ncbi:MAG TPA: N-6 DNA methylase [Longimicrobium sp.]|jgi:type I restriction enzyme M protein